LKGATQQATPMSDAFVRFCMKMCGSGMQSFLRSLHTSSAKTVPGRGFPLGFGDVRIVAAWNAVAAFAGLSLRDGLGRDRLCRSVEGYAGAW